MKKTTKNYLLATVLIVLSGLAITLIAYPFIHAHDKKEQQVKEDEQWREFFAWRE